MKYTNKQRAEMYLQAAKREATKFFSAIDYLYTTTGVMVKTELFKLLPELEILDGHLFFNNQEEKNLRILALLFAYQMAIDP